MLTKVTRFHNGMANKYEKQYQTPYWRLYHDLTWRHIRKYLPASKRYPILDAGGGTGYWSRKLAKLGFHVVCADIAEKMLEAGRRSLKGSSLARRIEFVVSDITNMQEFKDGSFSMALAQGDPVGYCGNPKKAIKELARVTRKGGAVIVSVDSFLATIGRIMGAGNVKPLPGLLRTHLSDFWGQYPQYNFSVEELTQLFLRNNISVRSIIGKTVFTNFMPRDKRDKLLADRSFYKEVLRLELMWNSDPSVVGSASHIEIVGIKT